MPISERPLSPVVWLWIPVIGMLVQLILEVTFDGQTLSKIHSENGPHETLQFIIMAVGVVFSVKALFSKAVNSYFLKFWFFLATCGCLYVAGEEVSWGQHIWDWATPQYWNQMNDQGETNLHNTSSWLDQKPRLVLQIGIIFGALIYPILKKKNIFELPSNLDFIMPSPKLAVIALFVLVPQIIEKIFEIFDVVIFARFSEVQEIYIFYFVVLYVFILHRKIKLQKNT